MTFYGDREQVKINKNISILTNTHKTNRVEGTYKIRATFEGSKSYGSSFDTTYITVDPAPSAAQPIETEEHTAAFALTTTELAIIAVVGIVAFWAIRKRK